MNISCTVDRKPGDIEALTDFMLEDYKNFPKVPELGEETARFIRQEMEDTWGSQHLSVLPEDEAQHWILGVGTLYFSGLVLLVPLKFVNSSRIFCINYLNNIYKQVKLSPFSYYVLIIALN